MSLTCQQRSWNVVWTHLGDKQAWEDPEFQLGTAMVVAGAPWGLVGIYRTASTANGLSHFHVDMQKSDSGKAI